MAECCLEKYKELDKLFKIIAFDWDGTAVENRYADASSVVEKLGRLLKLGRYIFIITGTNIKNVTRQTGSLASPKIPPNLYFMTNRGSEVYTSKPEGNILVYSRIATDMENKKMDQIVQYVKKTIEENSNLSVDIIYNRLNRRKIDLIPEWADTPKSMIDELMLKTEERLERGGFKGGIKRAYNLLVKTAMLFGLENPKITSDVKHLEIGLTDKADSIKWILSNVAQNYGISDEEIIVAGDEFGEIAGFEGSDSRMILDNHSKISYISFGVEPNGVPERITHAGGGASCFENFLAMQISGISNI